MAGVESDVQVPGGQTGPAVRTITLTTLVSGVPTSVQMEVVAISDTAGNLLDLSGGSSELPMLLKAMILRLDFLCYRMDSHYSPPDKLGL